MNIKEIKNIYFEMGSGKTRFNLKNAFRLAGQTDIDCRPANTSADRFMTANKLPIIVEIVSLTS